MTNGTMRLGALLHPGGQHLAAWRHKDGLPQQSTDIKAFIGLVQKAEQAKFDFAFCADVSALRPWPLDMVARTPHLGLQMEPFTMMAAVAAVTSHIGLVVTSSTTLVPPFLIARQAASLDLISDGRAAWNIVTSSMTAEAENYGVDFPSTVDRYRRAAEAVEVVKGLWSTTDDGVYLGDIESGYIFDPDKIHRYQHDGEFFRVNGTLTVPPSPQGRPVLIQAGASGPGRDFAASVAEVLFSASPTKAAAQEFSEDIGRRLAETGRSRSDVRIMQGMIPIIGQSKQHAIDRWAEVDRLIDDELSILHLSNLLGGADLSSFLLDEPLPELSLATEGSQTTILMLKRIAKEEGLTLRQIAARAAAGLIHPIVPGTVKEIADQMEDWFSAGCCDGFMINPLVSPIHLDDFIAQVVPELQRRGLFRTQYESATLRGNLGLPGLA